VSTVAAAQGACAQECEIRTVRPRFRPEFELLLASCLSASGDSISARGCNAQRLIALAEHHGLIPQLYSYLLANESEPALLSAVGARYETSSHRSLRLTAELLRIASWLQSCGIQAMPYKGPVLAEFLYGDVTQRQFGDLDFLVRSSDVPAAKKVLLEFGYTPTLDLNAAEERSYLATGNEYAFGNTLGRNLLELHWRILPRFYAVEFDFDRFWQRAIEIDISGWKHRTLCAEDSLLVSCEHAAKHAWPQLSMLRDISRLARLPNLNWGLVRAEGRRLGIQRILAINLLLARDLLGVPIPIQLIHSDRVAETVSVARAGALRDGVIIDTESIAYLRLVLQSRERLFDRLRILWRFATTPSVGEWSVLRLPEKLHWLYRLVRFWRLGKRLAGTAS
jgi:hypothetical protein